MSDAGTSADADGIGMGESDAVDVAEAESSAAADAAVAAAVAASAGEEGDLPVLAEPVSDAAEPVKDAGEPVKRKQRRRSLLSEEEGGLLNIAPTYRRSLLGY